MVCPYNRLEQLAHGHDELDSVIALGYMLGLPYFKAGVVSACEQ